MFVVYYNKICMSKAIWSGFPNPQVEARYGVQDIGFTVESIACTTYGFLSGDWGILQVLQCKK